MAELVLYGMAGLFGTACFGLLLRFLSSLFGEEKE